MNSRQKLVQQQFLNNEEKVINRLKWVYNKSVQDVNDTIKNLQFKIDELQTEYDWLDDNDPEKEKIRSKIQSKIYQKQYQEQLKSQLDGILDRIQAQQFTTVSEYLDECYVDGFIGTVFDAHGQGVPIITPINQEAMVRAVQLESKISVGLYTRLGENIAKLKKRIASQVSRGISSGMSYAQVAQQLEGCSKFGYNRAITIARTEGHRIQTTATMDAMTAAKEKGADVVKQWDSTLDDVTRESHRQVDGEIRELDKPFSNGLDFPGDPAGGPAEVICCRCALLQRARWALDEDELQILKDRAAYYELDKSTEFEDFKKKYLKATENSVDEIDIGNSVKHAVKSVITGGKVVSYDELPEKIRNNFEIGLKNSTTEARLAIKHELDNLDVCVNDNSKARFFSDVDLVQIRSDDDADTLAHEIFHRIDKKHKVNKKNDLLSPLKNDWDALQTKAQGDVVTYLVSEYPTAFTVKNSGKVVLRKEYRGISDIISGLSNNVIKLGYRHNNDYWAKKDALKKEAWAQFGRIMYSNNPDVQKMFENIFTSFNESAIIALKDVI